MGGYSARSFREEMTALYQEMEARQTVEAKIYKALDNMEAVIQHNRGRILRPGQIMNMN